MKMLLVWSLTVRLSSPAPHQDYPQGCDQYDHDESDDDHSNGERTHGHSHYRVRLVGVSDTCRVSLGEGDLTPTVIDVATTRISSFPTGPT